MSSALATARYGKQAVRVLRVVRKPDQHFIAEYNVSVLLEGQIETSYTQADNRVVVATDSMKNIVYYVAKTSPHVLVPELYAMHIGGLIVEKYAHIQKAFVTVEQLQWSRIPVDGKEHRHAFYRDGEDKRTTTAEVDGSTSDSPLTAKISSGISDLLVLKSGGSAFENFIRDEFTTLPEVDDRIFSTSVDLSWTLKPVPFSVDKIEDSIGFDAISADARKVTLDVFATDESASVQATLYKMAQKVIAQNAAVQTVSYSLPNKHYLAVDMKYIGIENLKPSEAEVFCPVSSPSGLITATVSRT